MSCVNHFKMPRLRKCKMALFVIVLLNITGMIYVHVFRARNNSYMYVLNSKWKTYENRTIKDYVLKVNDTSNTEQATKATAIFNNLYDDFNSKELSDSVHETDSIVKGYTRSIAYGNFSLPEPKFITKSSRDLFHAKVDNVKRMGPPQTSALKGLIYILKQGVFDISHDCGFRSNVSWIKHDNSNHSNVRWFPMLAPIVVPDGHTFQHFLDGTLPKIIQSLPILRNPAVKILMKQPRDEIIFEMFEKLNISKSRIVYTDGNRLVGADVMVFTCIAPPVHPTLWHMARRLLGAPEELPVPVSKAYIVIVTRKGCHNCGRNVMNQNELSSMLIKRYGPEHVKIFNGPISLNDSINLFGKAKIVIGSHGGGMYNINFAPKHTTVIEFMPTKTNGDMIAGASAIIWMQAFLLGQEYWRMCVSPKNQRGDIEIDLAELSDILDNVDKRMTY